MEWDERPKRKRRQVVRKGKKKKGNLGGSIEGTNGQVRGKKERGALFLFTQFGLRA